MAPPRKARIARRARCVFAAAASGFAAAFCGTVLGAIEDVENALVGLAQQRTAARLDPVEALSR